MLTAAEVAEELIRELRNLAARKWPDAPNQQHSLFGRAADALEGMLAAADGVLALGLEEDGATCNWPELQAAIKELRAARNGGAGTLPKTLYPLPQIGYYQAECCLLDLHKIETQDDLDEALARVEDNWEVGPLMVFATLEEAIARLAGDAALTPEERAAEYDRLGFLRGTGVQKR